MSDREMEMEDDDLPLERRGTSRQLAKEVVDSWMSVHRENPWMFDHPEIMIADIELAIGKALAEALSENESRMWDLINTPFLHRKCRERMRARMDRYDVGIHSVQSR